MNGERCELGGGESEGWPKLRFVLARNDESRIGLRT